mgnify:CR=1 FL=1
MKVLVATKDLAVFDQLQGITGLEYEEALFTGQIYEAVPGAQLVIIDFDDLVEHPYSVGMLRGILSDSDVQFVSSEEFLAEPANYISEAQRRGGEYTELPTKRTVAFVSYSGGVGKTVLSMDMAAHFARRAKLRGHAASGSLSPGILLNIVLLQGDEQLHRRLLRHPGFLLEALVGLLLRRLRSRGTLRLLLLILLALLVFLLVLLLLWVLLLVPLLVLLLLVLFLLLLLVLLLLALLLLLLLFERAERQLQVAARVLGAGRHPQRVAVGKPG